MASGMDKGLMALMGIEDDLSKDEGLAGNSNNLQSSQDLPSFFDDDEASFLSGQDDVDIEMKNYSKSLPTKDNTPSSSFKRTTTQESISTPTSIPRATTSSLLASPVYSSQEEPLFPSNFTPLDDPTSSHDTRLNHRKPTTSPPSFFSDSNPFGRPSPGKIRISRSNSSSSPSPSLFSPELNPFARPPSDKARLKKKQSSNGNDSFFSPTLSPRKPKKKLSSSGSSSNPRSLINTSTPTTNISSAHKHNRNARPSSPTSKADGGLSSPISSFSLNRQVAAMFSDSDSDISPIEDKIAESSSRSRRIALNASISSDMDTEMLSPNKSFSFSDPKNPFNQDQGQGVKWDEDELMQDLQPKQTLKPPSQKKIIEAHKDMNHLIRTSKISMEARVGKKYDLEGLLRQSQSQLNEKKNAARVPYLYTGNVMSPAPDRQNHRLGSPPPKAKIKTVALTDDSEDEFDNGATKSSQSKLEASKAFLIDPRQKRQGRAINLGIQPMDMLPNVENSAPMSPLSKTVSKMSISGGGDSASFHGTSKNTQQISITSPSKSQRVGSTGINLLKEEIRRKQAKSNMELRKKLATEAKKSGKWMAPEEYAAEQMLLEGDADDEDDEDYKSKETNDKGDDDGEMDEGEEEDPDYEEVEEGADEALALSGESDGEDENKVEAGSADVNDSDGNIEDAEDDDEGEDSDDDEVEQEVEEEAVAVKVKSRRSNTKKALIDDEDEVTVVVVNREVPLSESEDNEEDDDGDDENQDSDENDDDEVLGNSDDEGIDNKDIADDSQSQEISGSSSLLNFFVATDRRAGKTQENLPVIDSTPAIESPATMDSSSVSMPSSDPSPNQSEDFSQSLVIPSGILSAKFTPSAPRSSEPLNIDNSMDKEDADMDIPIVESSQLVDPSQPRNAFDVLTGAQGQGLRRLRKKEAKPGRENIAKGVKSAFIEYEAEEEDDEHKGMGGIDYESENDQDDYDLGDGMIDTTATLDSQDAENVRKLHMKHEQDQHDKEISDLVHGIAAGNLWKRRNGQGDNLDIFDEEDMDGRFQRKKKLKVSEKFEKLADNPSTAAFARALKKEIDDDRIMFLSDPEESNDEAEGASKDKNEDDDDEDEEMEGVEVSDNEVSVSKSRPNSSYLEDEEEEEEDEPLNTDKRKERLRIAKLHGKKKDDSESKSAFATWAKTQTLPFGPSSSGGQTFMKTTTTTTLSEAEGLKEDHHIDEYNNILRRSKLIRDIMDGVADSAGPSVELITTKSSSKSFSFESFDDVVESTSTSFQTREEIHMTTTITDDPAMRTFAKPRMLARQSSSFLAEERRNLFLSAVGDEGAGSVKDVNKRKMTFGTGAVSSDSNASRQRS